MNTREARELVYELMALFFSGADVLNSKQSHAVKSESPLITLTAIAIKRPQNPPTVIIGGVPVSYHPTTLMLQADLYTKGAPVEIAPGYTVPMENTALNDLVEFCNFVNSEYVANWSQGHDVALAVNGQVMDTTSLINGAGYEFRATVELTLGFTEQAVGYTGILDPYSIKYRPQEGKPNPDDPGDRPPGGDVSGGDTGQTEAYIEPEFTPSASGGGSEELAKESIGYFTEAEITHKEEKLNGKQS